MNLEISFIFVLTFNHFHVEGHQGTAISKYRLISAALSPTQQFYRTSTRGKIECSKMCSSAENCKYFRYNVQYKICRLYTPQFLKTAQNSTSFQVYVAGKCCYELVGKMSWHNAKVLGRNLVNAVRKKRPHQDLDRVILHQEKAMGHTTVSTQLEIHLQGFENYCENKGGSLVNIKTEEKQRELTDLLQHPSSVSNEHHWIGGIGKTNFYWTDGSAVSSGFQNWGFDIDLNIFTDECMYLHGYLDYRWYNNPCSYSFRSICEYVITT